MMDSVARDYQGAPLAASELEVIQTFEAQLGERLVLESSRGPHARKTNYVEIDDGHVIGLKLDSYGMKRIPESIGNLKSLRELSLVSPYIKQIPSTLWQLTCLTELEIGAGDVREIPATIGDLRSLEYLYLDIEGITELPPAIGSLRNLSRLKLVCHKLETLPARLSELAGVVDFELESWRLKVFPEAVCHLRNLRELRVTAPDIEVLPPSITRIPQLQRLILSCAVKELPSELGALTQLEYLDLLCWKLGALPDSVKRLGRLRTLKIRSESLSSLDAVGELHGLETLYVYCAAIDDLEFIGSLGALRSLRVCSSKLKEVPSSLSQLTALEELVLAGAYIGPPPVLTIGAYAGEDPYNLWVDGGELTELPHYIGDLKELRTLKVRCKSATLTYPPSIERLPKLEEFKLETGQQILRALNAHVTRFYISPIVVLAICGAVFTLSMWLKGCR